MQQPWPADRVERWAIDRLLPARNARTHSPSQVDQIAASMREWGWSNYGWTRRDSGRCPTY